MEMEYIDQSPALPIEMILKIISNLKNIDDIKNCMLLSKEVSISMLKSPEVMRNIKYQIRSSVESEKTMKVLRKHGRYIRCISILSEVKSPKIFKNLLSRVLNLEELVLETKMLSSFPTSFDPNVNKNLSDYWNDDKYSLDMSKLKTLKIDVRDLGHFLKNTKNVKNLTTLTIFSYDSSSEDFMFDFICQQHNLKDLNIINHSNIYLQFPREDPFSKVKFRLRRLKVLTNWQLAEENGNFSKFLAIHAESLEELEVDYSLSPQSLKLIFEKSHKLQKLSLKSNKNSELYSRSHQNWILPNLKHFDDQNSDGLNLDTIVKKFPNIVTLKCKVFTSSSKKIETLKILEVDNINAFCVFREEVMRNTLTNIKNLEHLVIEKSTSDIYSRILKHLDILTKLKSFSYRTNPYMRALNRTKDNEEIPVNYQFYKIIADMENKTVKVSNYILHCDMKLLDYLAKTYQGFEFYSFCFSVIKMERINVQEILSNWLIYDE